MTQNVSTLLSASQQQTANLAQHPANHAALALSYDVGMNARTSKEIRRHNLLIEWARNKLARRKLKDLGIALDVSPNYINQLLSGHRAIGDAVARKFEAQLGLREGEFDTLWPDPDGLAKLWRARDGGDDDLNEPTGDFVRVPIAAQETVAQSDDVLVRFYPKVRASAGKGFANTEPGNAPLHLKFRGESLRRRGIDPATAMVIYAEGDSMEPLIGDGDTIMFDRSKADLVDGGLFVIEIDDETMVKRLHRRPGGRVLIHSENEKYPAYEVSMDANGFRMLGRVVWGAGWLS